LELKCHNSIAQYDRKLGKTNHRFVIFSKRKNEIRHNFMKNIAALRANPAVSWNARSFGDVATF